MQLKIMTWNTALKDKHIEKYKHIEKDEKDINKIIAYIQKFLQENTNAVAVLQEIPYKETVNWKVDPVNTYFEESFNKYAVFANSASNVRMMTVIVTNIKDAKALPLRKHPDHPLNRDCAVAVPCDGTNIVIYGIHASNGADNEPYLNSLSTIADMIKAHIVLGDFNAGDYDRCGNQETFNTILPGYACICNGPTREVKKNDKLIRESCIDHVFVKDELEANVSELIIHSNKYLPSDDKNLPSDHYPITFTLEISDRKGG